MRPADACAVVHAGTADSVAAEVVSAAREQSVPPDVVMAPPGLAAAVDALTYTGDPGASELGAAVRAGARRAPWVWLLDGRAVPDPEALAALLAARDAVAPPSPVLLASKVLDRDGRLHPDSAPRHEVFEKAHSIDAAERHLVHLRAAAPGSVLVSAAAVDRFAPPRPDLPPGLDMYEWSARMLRGWDDPGYLVPASVAVRAEPPTPASWRYLSARARVLGSSAWNSNETLWEAFMLGRDAARALAGGQGRRGVGAPGFRPSRRPRRMIGTTRGEKR